MEVMSAVRLPTPDPLDAVPEPPLPVKRKRSPSPPQRRQRRFSNDRRSQTPPRQNGRARSPGFNGPLPQDTDRERAVERARQLEARFARKDPAVDKTLTAEDKQRLAKEEYNRLLSARSGGTYIPPAKLRALQEAMASDPSSKEFQRMAWDALKKSINGLINKVNTGNIKYIVPELFNENLVRGRGLFCRSIMKAQASSLPFTPIFACMAAIVNTKLPQVGELLVKRLVMQFRKAFKRNDKNVCLSSAMFIAQLVNQQVVHELVAAQMLLLLLNKPTDDSVEIAVGLTRECGQHLQEYNTQVATLIWDQFRSILHEADISKRTQYMIEVLFQARKDGFKENPAIPEDLDLIEEEDQITHQIMLEGELSLEEGCNIFKFDEDYEAHEEEYKTLKAQILGEADGSDEESDDDDSSDEDNEEGQEQRAMEIKDESNQSLVNLRRTIYLTMKSSSTFEEATHKLTKLAIPPGQEEELVSMVIETASQERTGDKFYFLTAERLCKLSRLYCDLFESAFAKYYTTIHRYENNRLRIIAQMFGHLLAADAIGWHVLSVIHLNEDETTASSRIFIKILFEEVAQHIGMKKLTARMRDDLLQPAFANVFPRDEPRNTRFAINFFTAIGMGALTEDMREYLKNLPKPELPILPVAAARSPSPSESVSSYDSYSSYSSSSRSRSVSVDSRDRSRSRSPPRRSARGRSRSPAPRGRAKRSPSYSSYSSRSHSPPRRGRGRSDSLSRSPPRRRDRDRSVSSVSRSRSPPQRGRAAPPRARDVSVSRSGSPPPPKRETRRDGPSKHATRRSPSYDSYSERERDVPRRSNGAGRDYGRDTRSSYDGKGKGRAGGNSSSLERSMSPPPRRAADGGVRRGGERERR